MANSIDTPSDVLLTTLVTFSWGAAPTFAYYCTGTEPIPLDDVTFLPEPSIAVEMNQQQGGSQDLPVKLTMQLRAPLDALSLQSSHAPVTCRIEELNPADVTSRRTLFSGPIRSTTRNPTNKSGLVEAQISGWRFPLTISANAFLANPQCNNTFGDAICGFDLEAKKETATISGISGAIITLTGLTTTAVNGYWRLGSVEYDGLKILVRAYITGSTMTLLKQPPPDWLGKAVLCEPGCDKLITTCRANGREQSFLGLGIGVPAYNPYFESPK